MKASALLAALLLALVPAWAEKAKESAPRAADETPAAPVTRAGLASAAARRNENVQVNRIDNEALKESNIRLGDNVTVVSLPLAETGYYAAEHGRPAAESAVLRANPAGAGWHGEIYEFHQNSVFNARTFFQVGPVKPSHQNNYGLRLAGDAPRLGMISGSFGQRKIRGMVNGNVLVPLAAERTALAADPALRSFVNSLLAKYPDELPNRPDFDPRALNTNAPQRIDELNAALRLDRDAGRDARLALSHALGRQRIDAFQFVAGQNPDTEIHNHRSRISYTRARSPAAEMALGFGFTRVRSDLRPEPNAAPMRIRIGFQIEELGPDSHFPIHRAQNSYRAGAVFRRLLDGGRHALTFGGDLTRFQLNGIETNNARGFFSFTNNFGRTAIENLRRGTPAAYEVSLGALSRGFRNWTANLFLGDQWKVNSRLHVYYGLRFNLDTTPTEVNALNVLPYGCDCNNFGPRLSIAWRLPGDWMARTSYTVSFGQILPVTYQQVRNNLPLVRYIQVQNPGLLDPLRGINLSDPSGRAVPTIFSPDLVAPYVHQYNFSLERALGRGYTLRLAYIGSRGIKLLNSHVDNRALPIAPLTLDTVDQRRPDPRYYEINRIVNGGIAYLDAVQAAVEGSYRNGLAWAAAYTFGKAIDQGSDYAFTAAGRDLLRARSQSQFESFKDKKSLSTFDSPHALLAWYAYDLPIGRGARGGWSMLARDWQISGSALLKSGTPLTLYIGSDAPGFGNVDGGPSDRPNILDPSILGMSVNDPDTAPLVLRRDRFAFIRPYENRGSLGRNTFRKDSIANLNAAITRQWRWGGATAEKTLLFRVEAFNLTNHPQFDEPQRNLTSPSFGRITNTLNDGRVLQVGIRLLL